MVEALINVIRFLIFSRLILSKIKRRRKLFSKYKILSSPSGFFAKFDFDGLFLIRIGVDMIVYPGSKSSTCLADIKITAEQSRQSRQ